MTLVSTPAAYQLEQQKAQTELAVNSLEQATDDFRQELCKMKEQLELVKENHHLELEKAQNKIRLLGQPAVQSEMGFSDGLLNKLQRIELDLNRPADEWQFGREKQNASGADGDANHKEEPLSNDQLLGELDLIQKSLKPARTRRQSKRSDAAEAAAKEFAASENNNVRVRAI